MRRTTTLIIGATAFLYSASATTAPEVTFVSPCECIGFHGKNRWVTKTDLTGGLQRFISIPVPLCVIPTALSYCDRRLGDGRCDRRMCRIFVFRSSAENAFRNAGTCGACLCRNPTHSWAESVFLFLWLAPDLTLKSTEGCRWLYRLG